MPDTLPPLEDIPDDLLTKPLNPTSSAGAWAATFGGSDTNLAQRRRHNEDLVQHGAAVQAAQKAHFMDELGRDKVKQDLYFRQKTLDSTIANRENALALRERQFDATLAAKEKMNEVTGDLRLAQTDLARQRAEALASNEKSKMLRDSLIAKDTLNFNSKVDAALQDGTVRPFTPEYADFVARTRAEHPGVGKNALADAWKSTNLSLSPEEYAAKKAQEAATLTATQAKAAAASAELAIKERAQTLHEDVADVNKAAKESTMAAKEKADLTKEIQAIEKVRPPWKGTTGIFKDKNGVERFGKAELPWEESPVATPELKAEHQRYQNLILKRAAQDAGVTVKKFNPETGKIE